jgi:hypothetical protein
LIGKQGTDVGIQGPTELYTPGRQYLDLDQIQRIVRQQEQQQFVAPSTVYLGNQGQAVFADNKFMPLWEQQLRSLYCFSPETEILMESGKYKKIKDIQPHEATALGGKVEMIGKSKSDDLYNYDGVKVTGDHAVFENGKWIRVKDSEKSSPIGKEGEIYTIHTENHLVVTKNKVWTDSMETEENSKDAQYSLDVLNSNKPRNKKLERFLTEYFEKDSNEFKKIKTPF